MRLLEMAAMPGMRFVLRSGSALAVSSNWRSKTCVIWFLLLLILLPSCTAPMHGVREEGGALPPYDKEDITALSYWMREMQALNIAYKNQYQSSVLWQPWLDLPIIGLAAAGVGSLLFGGSTDLTAALGLGAGGLTALRTYANPQGLATSYLAGVDATECVIARAGPLKRSVDDEGSLLPKELRDKAADLRDNVRPTNAQYLAALPPAGSDDSQRTAFSAAQEILRQADEAAGAILAAYGEEHAAARNSASVLAATLGRIKVAVARAVQRDAPTFGQVHSDVVGIVEQAGAQQQRLQTARDLIAGRDRPGEVPAMALPLDTAVTIRQQAALTAARVSLVRDMMPPVIAMNASIAQCQTN